MVFKVLSGGASGDLGNAGDNYGYFADTVLVIDGGSYSNIYTYEGNDIVDTTRPGVTGSSMAILGTGNDIFRGGAGSDGVADGSGNDSVDLGTGNDAYYMSSGNDIVKGGAGSDFIYFYFDNFDYPGVAPTNAKGVTFDLAKTTVQNLGVFGNDTASGFESLLGSAGNDSFFGTDGVNLINGSLGNDLLEGRGSDDHLIADNGKDQLIGGTGADTIEVFEAVASMDIVIYQAVSDSGISATKWDSIYGFDAGGTATDDKINIKAIDANAAVAGDQAFVFKGTVAFSLAGGEVRLQVLGGVDTLVHIDTDADAADEMAILVSGVTGLTAADFIL